MLAKLFFNNIWIFLSIICTCGFFGVADILSNQTPENQVISLDTMIDATGVIDKKNSLNWMIASPGSIPEGTLLSSQVMAHDTFKNSLLTNGGKLIENNNFAFNSQDMAQGMDNIDYEKVLTFESIDGAHMTGEEEFTIATSGNWTKINEGIRCVFSGNARGVPAFCNGVSAKGSMININSAQISTKGNIRSVTNSISIPMEINYRISVSPDLSSGRSAAEGTVRTDFAGSIMEARTGNDSGDPGRMADPSYANSWNRTAATNQWKDSTTVTGGIRNFQKVFGDPPYISGFDIQSSPVFNDPPEKTVGGNANQGVTDLPKEAISGTPKPTKGTYIIVDTTLGVATWTLRGTGEFYSGTGSRTIANLPFQDYTFTKNCPTGSLIQTTGLSATNTPITYRLIC